MKAAARRLGMTPADYAVRVLRGEKWCNRCRCWKTRTLDFGRDTTRRDGIDAVCRACREAPGRRGPSRRERRERARGGEAWCCGCAAWRSDVRAGKCREHLNAAMRLRYATDPEFRYRRRQNTSWRRRNVDAVPPEGEEALLEKYGGRCVYCSGAADSVDHLLAVSKSGRTTPGNVVPACRSCNSKKRDKDLDDWLDELQAQGPLSDDLMNALAFMECSLYG